MGVPLHTLFQVSTSGALVRGVYEKAVSTDVLLDHGDFGLGTGGPIAQTRPLLLAGAGGEPPDAAAVRCHAGEDCGVAVTGGLGSSLSVAKFRLFAGILGKITALPRPAG
jgi:hypothetical protein